MNKWLAILLIFLFSMSLRVWNLNEMGRTWDEQQYVEQGYKMVELIKKGDFNNSFFFTTYDHPPLVKYLYGLTAHLDVEKHLPNGDVVLKYDLTHSRLLSAALFSLGVGIVVLLVWEIFTPIVGIYSGVILAMLPFSLGLSQLVTAESLKIFIYPLSIYVYIQLIKSFSWKKALVAGIVTGIALQAKQSNALLLPILGAMLFFQFRKLNAKERIGFVKVRIKSVLLIALISVLTFIAFWPQIIFHFKEIFTIHDSVWSVQFSPKIWQITLSPPEIFFGRLMLTPIFYYVVYFFITVPVLILFLFFTGIRQIIKLKNIYLISILIWFLIPFALSIYSWRQHGLRYIIEIYPAIAIISGLGLDALTRKFAKTWLKKYLAILFIAIYLFISLWSIKPYFLDYFNELAGGVNTVYKYNLFQTGWWGQGLRDAGLYLKANARAGSRIGLAISPELTLPRFDSLKYSSWSAAGKYDYVVVNNYHVIRDGFNRKIIERDYKPVHFVMVDKAILVTVYKLK